MLNVFLITLSSTPTCSLLPPSRVPLYASDTKQLGTLLHSFQPLQHPKCFIHLPTEKTNEIQTAQRLFRHLQDAHFEYGNQF